MTTGALIWLALFAINAGLFFAIALVVTIRGMGELRDLLRSARPEKKRP